MKLFYIILIVLCPAFCYSQWVRQTSNTSEILNNVHFINNNIGYVVGNNGVMVKTTDGGTTWTNITTGINSGRLLSVFFIDKDTGWICGTDGVLMKTKDAGVNWTAYNTGFTTNLSGLYFTDKKNGFAVGEAGKVMKTINGGRTWSSQKIGSINYIGAHFTDSLNGYACGGSNTVIHTPDAGVNWYKLNTDVNSAPLFCVKFLNNKVGYAVGAFGRIIKTSDGGTSWVNQTSGISAAQTFYSIFFLDSLNGWAPCASTDSIVKTTDGGKNWMKSTLNFAPGYYNIFFTSGGVGYIAGKNGAIFKLASSRIANTVIYENNLLIFPNPASTGFITVSSQFDIHTYRLYDINGRVVDFKFFDSKKSLLEIDIGSYSNGSYILEVNINGTVKRQKLLINR